MKDKACYTRVKELGDLLVFKANIVNFSFKKHEHDYYAIGIIENGYQKFSCAKNKNYITPPKGVSIINPGDAHTGESVFNSGFHYEAIYPSIEQVSSIAKELELKREEEPIFACPVISDDSVFLELKRFLLCISNPCSTLSMECQFLNIISDLLFRYANKKEYVCNKRKEAIYIKRARSYIEDNYMKDIRLDTLAREIGLSPYYFIRMFHEQVGLPPHAYLESVRIRRSQHLLRQKKRLVDIAHEIGYCNQSHFTSAFKAIIGVSPGKYIMAIS